MLPSHASHVCFVQNTSDTKSAEQFSAGYITIKLQADFKTFYIYMYAACIAFKIFANEFVSTKKLALHDRVLCLKY